jgi:hypothetical protein
MAPFCHRPEARPAKLEAEHLVTIFDGKVKLPEDYFRKVKILPLIYGRHRLRPGGKCQGVTACVGTGGALVAIETGTSGRQ